MTVFPIYPNFPTAFSFITLIGKITATTKSGEGDSHFGNNLKQTPYILPRVLASAFPIFLAVVETLYIYA